MNGRTRTSFGAVGGYSFNHASVDRPLPLGVAVDVTVQNAWVAQPRVDVTFAATRRLALLAAFDYTWSNPDVSVAVSQGGQQTSARVTTCGWIVSVCAWERLSLCSSRRPPRRERQA